MARRRKKKTPAPLTPEQIAQQKAIERTAEIVQARAHGISIAMKGRPKEIILPSDVSRKAPPIIPSINLTLARAAQTAKHKEQKS